MVDGVSMCISHKTGKSVFDTRCKTGSPEHSSHHEISSFWMKRKPAIHSKHLHANVSEMYGEGKYVEINYNKTVTVS